MERVLNNVLVVKFGSDDFRLTDYQPIDKGLIVFCVSNAFRLKNIQVCIIYVRQIKVVDFFLYILN